MTGEQVRFLQTLYPCKVDDEKIIPPNAAGFHHSNAQMRAFADQLITAGLLESRGTDSCGTMWFWPTCFEKIYDATAT